VIITRANWFEHFFNGIALDCWRNCLSPEQTRAEADFLQRILGKKSRLLDVPCGNGRHSLELARRGHRITGLDISSEFVAEARANARMSKGRVEFVEGDMRRLQWKAGFDGAFCMGNSFGYLEYPGMLQFVRGLSRALKPGGRLVIETGCVAECLLPSLKEREWYQVGDILFAIENRYDVELSCLETEATFVKNGKTDVRRFWHWVYTIGEIKRLLAQGGLSAIQLYGSLEGQPFKMGDPRLLLVAQKPSAKKPTRT